MPRPLIHSNGRLFLGIDERYSIRDLFYPHVGLYNHLSGHAIRMGIWVDGAFSWLDEDGWNRELRYVRGTTTSVATLGHPAFGVEIECEDLLDPHVDVFRRSIEFRSTYGSKRLVRIFFTHDLRIAETDIGDTAFFNPYLDGIVHYKGPHWVLFRCEGRSVSAVEYATGIKGFNGLEGTWRDAEDGKLSMNPIAQGSVDSTLGVQVELDEEGKATFQYRILAAESLSGLEELNAKSVSGGMASHGIEEGSSVPSGMLKLEQALPADLFGLCERSLAVIEAHCDHQGAILAATDSDIMTTNRANYCYCWPRDGAHVCLVLDRLGMHEPTRRFFRFCARVLSDEHPVLLQKYRPDGTLGATWHPWLIGGRPETPFQEDESASVLHALGVHFGVTRDASLLEELYPSLVLPMADFIAAYRDSKTGLPRPSYDLWEERRGVHLYTSASVFAGLRGAAELANLMDDPRAFDYREASTELRRGIKDHFLRVPEGTFYRSLGEHGERDPAADASTLHLGLFGVLDAQDPAFGRQLQFVREKLWVTTEIGGIARYEDDYYFRRSDGFPGNPWIICTLWLAQCLIARANTRSDLDEPLELMRWALGHSGSTLALPEQLDPHTGSPLSVSPLTWSHSEFLKTALDWAEKLDRL